MAHDDCPRQLLRYSRVGLIVVDALGIPYRRALTEKRIVIGCVTSLGQSVPNYKCIESKHGFASKFWFVFNRAQALRLRFHM